MGRGDYENSLSTPERPVERVRERVERSAHLVARTPSPRNSPPVVVSGTVSLLRCDGKGRLMGDENRRTNDDPEDDRPNDGFDYGERREDTEE